MLPRLEARQKQVKDLKKGSSQQAAADVGATALELAEGAMTIGSAKVVVAECEVGAKELAGLADKLRAEDGVCGVIITRVGGKVVIVAFASRDLAGKTIHAGKIVKEVAGLLGGGGGGGMKEENRGRL